MAKILHTIDEYAATVRKKTTIWMVFNTGYNDVHAFKKKRETLGESFKYLDKNATDNDAREEFLTYMQTNFPDTTLVDVFDLVDAGFLQYPYLGSIAIDVDVGSDVYNALAKKYGDPYGDATLNNAVLWIIEYEDACAFHKEREERLDAEFAD